MRIKINFSVKQNQTLTVDNQHLINSFIHKCLGVNNKYHDSPSDYCISTLRGGKFKNDALLYFPKNNCYLIVTALDMEFLNKLLAGILNNPFFTDDIVFKGIDFITETLYKDYNKFITLSPILLRETTNWEENKYKFITLKDDNFISKLEEQTKRKLLKVSPNLDLSRFKIELLENKNNKVKSLLIKNVINHGSVCKLKIYANQETTNLIYKLGLGQSTGCGFGTLVKTENLKDFI